MNEAMNQEVAWRERAQKAISDHYAFLAAGDLNKLIEVWDEHGVYEFPFPPPGFPERIEGKPAIHNFLKSIVENVKFYRWLDMQFYLTPDPDILIVEFRSEGQAVNTERRYNQAYVSIVRVREGKIALLKEYLNPLIVVEAFGTDQEDEPTA